MTDLSQEAHFDAPNRLSQRKHSILDAALEWAEKGVPVFPVGSNKAPLTPNGHKDASTDPARVREMFAGNPWGIGAAMGRESGLFAVDSDHYKEGQAGEDAAAFIADLEAKGLLPETRTHTTQSGGRHYLFWSDTDWPNCKPSAGVEVKGEGGYIVVPPSPGYEIEHEGIADAPAGLIDLLKAKKAAASMTPTSALKAAILAGDDFHDSLTLLAARRAAEGASPERVQAELLEVLNASVAASERHPRHRRWRSLVEDRSKELSRIVFSAESKFNPDAASAALRDAAAGRFGTPAPVVPLFDGAAALQAKVQHSEKTRRGFGLVPIGALEIKEPRFLIEGLIEEDTLAQIFGEPGVGKSLVAFDMAACIATGTPFHGRAILRQGGVIVIAGEGHNGIRRRFAAWENREGQSLAAAPLSISTAPAQILAPESLEAVRAAIDAIAVEHGPPALIVVDTLARNFGPGDENSNKDMTAFIAGIDALRAEYGCTVLLVHHSGHAEPGRARGASALRGAVDAEFAVARAGKRGLTVSNKKMKDAPPPGDLAFIIESHEVGRLSDGSAISSVSLREVSPQQFVERKLTDNQARAVTAWHAARKAAPAGVEAVPKEMWQEEFCKLSSATKDEDKRRAFRRTLVELQEAGIAVEQEPGWKLVGGFAQPDSAAFASLGTRKPRGRRPKNAGGSAAL